MNNHITSSEEVKQQSLTNVVHEGVLTMTSREISAMWAKDHKNVIRDIRTMLDELSDGSNLSHLDRLKFERIYKDASNRDQTEYCLPKDLTLTSEAINPEYQKIISALLPESHLEVV